MKFQLTVVLVFAAVIPYVLCGSVKIGEKCDADADCISNAMCKKANGCKKGLCNCKEGYTKKADACVKIVVVDFDGACGDEKVCGERMACTKSKCACDAKNKEDNKKCVNALTQTEGQACDDVAGTKCIAGLVCTSKKCACSDADYVFNSGVCLGALNDAACGAGKGKKCHLAYNLECKTSKCTCKANFNWGKYVDGTGKASNQCVHKDVTKDVDANGECKVANDNTGKICKEGYRCSQCPEDSVKKCYKLPEETTTGKSLASTVVINSFFIFSAATLKIFF